MMGRWASGLLFALSANLCAQVQAPRINQSTQGNTSKAPSPAQNTRPESLQMALKLNKLANTYSDRGQYEKARPLKLRALAINERVLGLEHPRTATALINLAITYGELQQHAKALPLQLRALAIREKVQGPAHPDTATALLKLASTLRALAQYYKALPLDIRVLAIREKVQGPEHPDTALNTN